MTNDKIRSTICDSICRHPYRVESQAELDILCEDCVVNKLKASDGDLISRQAAIDAIDGGVSFMFIDAQKQGLPNQMDGSWFNAAEVITTLEWLPSAQPLVLTCDGCRHVGTYDTDFPCSGCIRREKDYYEQER